MKRTIEINRKAHFYVQEPSNEPNCILYVIHGYAQLALEFLQEFSFLNSSSVLVVAPEAISKFYNKERKAVANWMTSHERLDEIQDYVNFLNQVHQELATEYGKLPIAVLGFSQGVSTVLRWICNSKLEVEEVFLCSGTIPPELKASDFSSLKETSFNYYFGNKDKLLVTDNALKQIERLKQMNLKVIQREYGGRHEISERTKADLSVFSESY